LTSASLIWARWRHIALVKDSGLESAEVALDGLFGPGGFSVGEGQSLLVPLPQGFTRARAASTARSTRSLRS